MYEFFNKLKLKNAIKYDSYIVELLICLINTIEDEYLIIQIKEALDYIINQEEKPYNNVGIVSSLNTSFFKEKDIIINFINQIFTKIQINISETNDLFP